MANSKYIIEFEQLLKKKSSTKLPLYSKDLTTSEPTYKPKDVIEAVYSQMKAMHLADCSKNVKKTSKDLTKPKKSDFLPVNKLPVYHQINQIPVPDKNKFETQCDLNTQIMNIIDGSEAIGTNSGMTQEFDTTFSHIEITSQSHIEYKNSENMKRDKYVGKGPKVFSEDVKKDEVILDQEKDKAIVKKINQSGEIFDTVEAKNNGTEKNIVYEPSIEEEQAGETTEIVRIKTEYKCDANSSVSKTASEDHSNIFIQILPSTQETDDKLKEIDGDFEEIYIDTEQRSHSPVFNLKPRDRKSKTHSPLVVSLETFENFENMAITLIEDNTDYETAKHLINSQILGTELCLNFNTEILSGIERNYSPILELKRDELKINSQDLKTSSTKQIFDNVIPLKDINITEKRSDSLKDEILFSSDEENEYINKELNDLPLTCALETSIDNQPGVLEKTMYVGFQTASNKSIQICTDSFDKAQSILEEKEETVKEFSFSELVEKIDVFRAKPENSTNSTTEQVKDATEMNKAGMISGSIINEEKLKERYDHKEESNEPCENLETKVPANNLKHNSENAIKNQNFIGFMTANFKKINMSDKAFEKCKKAFHDIDLDDGFDAVDSVKIDPEKNIVTYENENKKKASDVDYVEEMTVDDKINDELLLQEFENIEMSLEDNENKNEPVNDIAFKGFKTANNKNISISKEAMSKTKNVFQGIDEELNKREKEITLKPQANKVSDQFMSAFIRSDNIISFKTANHKNIDLSTQAFAETKSLFQDIKMHNELNIIEDQPSTSKAVFIGFKTANNKDITVSDQALCKTVQVFKDIDRVRDIDPPGIRVTENVNQPSTSKAVFVGFKTANNKDIKTSDEALCKTKDIFKDIDKQKPETEVIDKVNLPTTSNAVFAGFKTASNKNIKICDDALVKSRHMFNDIDKNALADLKNEDNKSVFKGFKTASNRNIKVSEQALEKGRKLFQVIDVIPSERSVALDRNTKLDCAGFKTANNNAVNILSAEALANSKKLFADVNSNNFEHALASIEANKGENLVFKGFQTASKKPVSVSANALARSKRVFQDIDDGNENIPEEIPTNTKQFGFKGFQTANKKPVEVRKEALLASQKLFNEFNDNPKENFIGFKTASNKNVNIPDEALAKSKRLFDDIQDFAPKPSKLDKDVLKEFKAANSKVVEIPKDALEKAKHLLVDDDDSAKKETSFRGFQTANNEKVTVSKESIAKSKQLFHDIDTENDINANNTDNINTNSDSGARIEVKSHPIAVFGFQAGNNKKIEVSEDSFMKTRKFFAEDTVFERDKTTTAMETKKDDCKDLKLKNDAIYIDGILNTQVLNNFEENLCTEDFKDTPRPNKRSGSPILPCPRAKKKKKFETPYRSNPKTVIDFNKDIDKVKEPANIIKFKDNYKKNKAYTYKDLSILESGKNKSIDPYITNFNLENILDFEFTGTRNNLTEEKMTMDKIRQLFTEATDKKLIPEGWMDIQLKLILWKLISYEIKFPESLGVVCTVQNVIDQLKYRYDRELYNMERPVLRKILEKDDVSTKTMVLCVAGVLVDGASVTSIDNPSNIELLLTDGWYFLKATIDKMLSTLVYEKKIVVGRKIMVSGAELMNCDQGVSPWEDTSAIRLSISGNSTFPVHSTARLGLHRAASPLRLAAVRPTGGAAMRLRVGLVRRYPPLYVERLKDGSTVTRSERLEYQYQMKYEAEREAMIEKIYEEVEKELAEQESQDSDGTLDSSNKRKCCDSGSQIAKQMKTSKDPMEFRAQLTSTQVQLLQEHTSAQRDKHLQAIQDKVQERMRPRNVVTLVRGRIVDLQRKGDNVVVTKGMLSVWKPNEEVLDIFKEGSWFEVMNVLPTGVRNSEIQLSAGRQSVFRRIKHKEEDILKSSWESLKRTCCKIKELSQRPSMITEYNEIDTVGIIFSIDPPNREFESIKNQFQNLYLADIDKNMISINFWGGIKKFGYENVLDTGQVVYCGNLQKRAGNSRKNIPQYRATEFSLFTKTPRFGKAREITEEINKKMFGLDRRKFCEDCLAVKQNYSVIKSFRDSEISPHAFHNSDYSLARNKIFIDTPVGVKVAKSKQDDLNLTGLDFESTFKQQDTQELSPKTLFRKKKVNEKIARLKMYGEPPPLSPINLINKSKNAASSYKSPLLSKTDGVATPNKTATVVSVNNSENVATLTKLPDQCVKLDVSGQNIVSSPILATNRTYVVRSSINPVKLNFSENAVMVENGDITVDHFAEDFDGSPPLSLD